ncbi:type II secretion system protein [Lentilactobacillus hilgardii]|uniref:Type II secretion system protein n=1 Tax=Lentilactobacillus hilgardii TaxID=1588 RepID=A0A6P1ED42_LENHI|nr:type II secretion system protein [Lentilactobacillus hilgardii]QHB51954.1 type II secretion system protein [Lentilactobacillus hilgardii]RRG11361.1 MAG: type II secretion system protein [Lactobacillus sp.]
MALELKRKTKDGFTLIDSLIGLTIISLFSLFYIGITHQMNDQIDQSQKTLKVERKHYEDLLRNE